MKKIAIVTLVGYFNYGNRLQNYAVDKIIRKYGFVPETIVKKNFRTYLRDFKFFLKAMCGSIAAKRFIKLKQFSKKHLSINVIPSYEKGDTSKLNDIYDYFIVGSDQVWNPLLRQKDIDFYFLDFVEQEKRICIAPSFGVSELSKEYRELFCKGLAGFNYLCCREKEGIKIIEELLGVQAQLLIDPTLVLEKREWEVLYHNISLLEKKFILCGFIGEMEDSYKNVIEKTALDRGLKIINVFEQAYGVEELLWLIDNAELVCTDSFHFSAFSINFNTPFSVFYRKGNDVSERMFSRLTTLLSEFQLEDRVYNSNQERIATKCSFDKSNEILKLKRAEFYNYYNGIFEKEVVKI